MASHSRAHMHTHTFTHTHTHVHTLRALQCLAVGPDCLTRTAVALWGPVHTLMALTHTLSHTL